MLGLGISAFDKSLIVLYVVVIGWLGWLGYRRTRTATDYLIAGRQTHPFVMALSYGSTFISTSAIIGFGGVAAMFGMSLLWLVFLNIFVGIFIAFAVFGARTRHMGHRLDAHTFAEFLGRRYQCKSIQVMTGLVIFTFMPLYAAAVMIGGTEFMTYQFGLDYSVALLVFSIITAVYVVFGGIKGVMYTDALQAVIMLGGMVFLLIWTYSMLGGVASAHQALTDMGPDAFVGFKAIGHQGWTSMPKFGFGGREYELWWLVIGTITMGVGIGVLAQPQLVVRFLTVKSKRELNRAVGIGGVFILTMVGVSYVVGSLSNVYFAKHEKVVGKVVQVTEDAAVITKKDPTGNKVAHCRILHLDTTNTGKADAYVVAEGLGKDAAIMPKAVVTPLPDGRVEVQPRATSYLRAVVPTTQGGWMFNTESIIPIYVAGAMPHGFSMVFLLTLLAAAMSTLSSQFHTLGAAISRDVYEQMGSRSSEGHARGSIVVVRIGTIVGIILATLIAYQFRGGYIVARATAIFFGLCAAAFIPAYMGGLFFRRMTRAGAVSSMVVGFLVSTFWLILVFSREAGWFGLVQRVTEGKTSLLWNHPNWPVVDPLLVALPLSILTAIVVSWLTQPPPREHLEQCFGPSAPVGR